MSSHARELGGLFDAREEEEIEFENEGVETSPTSTNSDGFTEVKDSDDEGKDEPSKIKAVITLLLNPHLACPSFAGSRKHRWRGI